MFWTFEKTENMNEDFETLKIWKFYSFEIGSLWNAKKHKRIQTVFGVPTIAINCTNEFKLFSGCQQLQKIAQTNSNCFRGANNNSVLDSVPLTALFLVAKICTDKFKQFLESGPCLNSVRTLFFFVWKKACLFEDLAR